MLRQDFAVVEWRDGHGVRTEVSASLILLAFVMIHFTRGPAEFLHDLAVFLLILLSLHLREMARAWVVGMFGLKLVSVRLSAAGGLADHSRATAHEQETIAAMGPIVSLGLWAVSSLILPLLPESLAADWLLKFAFINLFIGIVTALPVQPMDGGRFLYLYLGRTIGLGFARRVMGAFGLLLSVIWLPATLLSFLIFGIVLIALPSVREHWRMLRGAPALEG